MLKYRIMYRLNVSNMKDREIKNALGIFEETFSYDDEPPPPKLRRSYKTMCPICRRIASSIIKGERRSVCISCERDISKLALSVKVRRWSQERLQVRTALAYAAHRTPLGGSRYLQAIILNFLYY